MKDELCEFCEYPISEHIDEKPCPDDLAICGRTLEVVNEYASTCDGCSELTHHDLMVMDSKTQLGYCEMCIERGVEVWTEVVDWPNYEVSTLGNVRGRFGPIKTFLVQGYFAFNVHFEHNRRSLRVHREVLNSFRGPESTLCACHNDGNKKNCKLTNLRWDTHKGNEADKKRHGRTAKGVRHGMAKLTKEQASYIKTSKERGVDLATKFGITPSSVCAIRHGRSWRYLPCA